MHKHCVISENFNHVVSEPEKNLVWKNCLIELINMSAVRSKSTMVEEEKRMPFFNQVVPATMEPEELNQELNSGAESSFGDF